MRSKLIARLCAALLVGEAVLILTSWILSATMTRGVRSLLSDEGLRWLLGGFTEVMASPLLVWLVLVLIATGCFVRSGLSSVTRSLLTGRRASVASYRDRVALRAVLVFLIIYVAVVLLLTVIPHAILLSATGSLWPSPFSRSVVPLAAFGVAVSAAAFGVISGRLVSLTDILEALTAGLRRGAPLFLVYILAMQFAASLRFVFISGQ